MNEKELLIEKERFFRAIAHDLRNPLGQIEGALTLLRTTGGDKEEYDMIANATDSIRGLVDSITLVAKLENNNLELVKTTVNLLGLVDEVIESSKYIFEISGLNLKKEILNSDIMPIIADPQVMERVLFNLLSYIGKVAAKGDVVFILGQTEKEIIIKIKYTLKSNPLFKDDEQINIGLNLKTIEKLIIMHNGKFENNNDEFLINLPKEE